jgi:hypothetical protein
LYNDTKTAARLSTINYGELGAGSGGWKYESITGYAYATN